MAAKDFIWGNPRPEQEPNKYRWECLPLKGKHMKFIMENWKRFLTENKKEDIKNLKYGDLKNRKHIKRLAEEPKIIDIKLSEIPISKFPSNDSEIVKKELRQVLDDMTNNKEIDKKTLKKADKRPVTMFTKYLKDNKIEYDEEFLKNVYEDVSRITLKLKMRYNRPRPAQLGHLVGFDIRSIKTDTDGTPSFPSGHSAQAWTVAFYLASKHPNHKQGFFKIAEKIEKSRIVRGAHYPSDNKEAKKIAQKYLFPNIKERKQ